jgi:hypothetical protein
MMLGFYTVTAASTRPRRETERDYLMRVAREHRADTRTARRRRIVSRITPRPARRTRP